jgi:tRNA A37 N6-isopentenylltransferase MiaA
LAAVEALVARNSRRYAKRQITYFATIPGARYIRLHPDTAGGVTGGGTPDPAEQIAGELETWLQDAFPPGAVK